MANLSIDVEQLDGAEKEHRRPTDTPFFASDVQRNRDLGRLSVDLDTNRPAAFSAIVHLPDEPGTKNLLEPESKEHIRKFVVDSGSAEVLDASDRLILSALVIGHRGGGAGRL